MDAGRKFHLRPCAIRRVDVRVQFQGQRDAGAVAERKAGDVCKPPQVCSESGLRFREYLDLTQDGQEQNSFRAARHAEIVKFGMQFAPVDGADRSTFEQGKKCLCLYLGAASRRRSSVSSFRKDRPGGTAAATSACAACSIVRTSSMLRLAGTPLQAAWSAACRTKLLTERFSRGAASTSTECCSGLTRTPSGLRFTLRIVEVGR